MRSVVNESALIFSPGTWGRACLLSWGLLWALALMLGPASLSAETWVWIDEEGRTHFTDDPKRAPAGSAREVVRGLALADLWAEGLTGPALTTPPGVSGGEEDRATRILASAVADLERGEEARASAAFRSVLRLSPGRPAKPECNRAGYSRSPAPRKRHSTLYVWTALVTPRIWQPRARARTPPDQEAPQRQPQ